MQTRNRSVEQTTIATEARVAGNNFFENLVILWFGHWLSLHTDEERDAMGLRNGDAFRAQFLIDLPTELRPRVLEIKHEGKLTDRQIRHLVRAGALSRKNDQVVLDDSCVTEAVGWVFVTVSLLVGLAILIAGNGSVLSLTDLAKHVVTLTVFTMMAKAAHYTFVEPFRVARRALRALHDHRS